MHPVTKPTYSLPQFLRAVAGVARRSPLVAQVYLLHRLPPDLRERIWVAVSAANECRHCSFIHQHWAAKVGVPVDEIRALARAQLTHEERRIDAAVDYALAWLHAGFGPLSESAERDLAAYYSRPQRAQLRTVARFATLANLTGNTYDAFLERLRGRPAEAGRAIDEAVISAIFVVAAAAVVGAVVLAERKSPLRVLREFRVFSRGFAQERV